jgi:hypothetical protein
MQTWFTNDVIVVDGGGWRKVGICHVLDNAQPGQFHGLLEVLRGIDKTCLSI